MSLYKRGEFYWYDFTLGRNRYRGPTKQRGKAAARKVEDRERERAALGASRPVPTLGVAAAVWFVARAAGKKSVKTTALRLEIVLRLLDPYTPIDEIDSPEIEDAIQRRRLELSPHGKLPSNSTVNRDLIDTTLRPILRYHKRVLKYPLPEIDWRELRLQEPKGRKPSFSTVQRDAWRSALPPWHRPLFDFYKRYGPRLSEAFFHPSAFDPHAGTIILRERKNDEPHMLVLLPEDAAEMAARWGRAVAAGLDTVWFREMKNGTLRPIRRRGFQSASRAALDRARIADARPTHDLRHHAASAAMQATGGSLAVVQELLGHESPQSSMRYAHANKRDVSAALRHVADTEATHAEKSAIDNNVLGPTRTGT